MELSRLGHITESLPAVVSFIEGDEGTKNIFVRNNQDLCPLVA